jgi:hypothetical protein
MKIGMNFWSFCLDLHCWFFFYRKIKLESISPQNSGLYSETFGWQFVSHLTKFLVFQSLETISCRVGVTDH